MSSACEVFLNGMIATPWSPLQAADDCRFCSRGRKEAKSAAAAHEAVRLGRGHATYPATAGPLAPFRPLPRPGGNGRGPTRSLGSLSRAGVVRFKFSSDFCERSPRLQKRLRVPRGGPFSSPPGGAPGFPFLTIVAGSVDPPFSLRRPPSPGELGFCARNQLIV